MNHSVLKSVFFSLLLVIAIEILSDQKGSAQTQIVKTPNNSCVQLGRIVSIRGEAQLKRRGWKSYHLTDVGAKLCAGDLLQPTNGTRVVVQCAAIEQEPWIVPDGVLSGVDRGCRPPTEPQYNITKPITPTRDPLVSNVPYIIAPNNTWLLSDQFKIRWLKVPGSTVYVVRVSGPEVDWVTEVSTNEITYPAKPPLSPVEGGYLITVEAENGETARATFGLLDSKKADRVKAAIARLNKHYLTSDTKNLALAELYIGQGLIAEATELLETSAAKGSQLAAIYYTLGNLYAHVELFQQAEGNYLKAVKLAQTANDTEGQVAAATKLAQVYLVMGSENKAAYWSKQAQKKYQALKS